MPEDQLQALDVSRTLAAFSMKAGTQLLRPYQAEAAQAIVDSIRHGYGDTITVMMARQMGKNQTSAALEHFLLHEFASHGGQIVKAAPTFAPQLHTSKSRLERELSTPFSEGRWHSDHGYIIEYGAAKVLFYSANRASNVIGATADILLEIDEAQDVDEDKYLREFRPMASTTNATTVLYGTAWTSDCLLERQRNFNNEQQPRLGRQLHFEYPWHVLADQNAQYRRFVEAEIERLGTSHPIIRTQYRLECMSDLGRFLSPTQLALLTGDHVRQATPSSDDPPGSFYVAGVDIAGEDEQAVDAVLRSIEPRRDSTVATIARVSVDHEREPKLEIVEHYRWTGHDHKAQLAALQHVLRDRWGCRRVVVDATGIGAGIASWLAVELGPLVEQFIFTAPSKSRLAYNLLGMVNTGRCRMYMADSSDDYRSFWKEASAARYDTRANEQLGFYVPIAEGHDDYLMSLALCAHAAAKSAPPAMDTIITPRQLDYGDNWHNSPFKSRF